MKLRILEWRGTTRVRRNVALTGSLDDIEFSQQNADKMSLAIESFACRSTTTTETERRKIFSDLGRDL